MLTQSDVKCLEVLLTHKWPIGASALEKAVEMETVAVLPMGVSVSGTCNCIPISVVFNAATVAATATKHSKRISASTSNSKSPRSSSDRPVAVDVSVKVAKAEANYS